MFRLLTTFLADDKAFNRMTYLTILAVFYDDLVKLVCGMVVKKLRMDQRFFNQSSRLEPC
jgi:hypothetical protein